MADFFFFGKKITCCIFDFKKSVRPVRFVRFQKLYKKIVMDVSANKTINIAKVCLGFPTYDVQLPDIYLKNYLYNF